MLLTFVAHVNDPKIPDIPLFLKLIIVVTLYRALVALLAACAPAEFSLSCLCTICTSQVPNAQHLGHLYSCRHQSEKWPEKFRRAFKFLSWRYGFLFFIGYRHTRERATPRESIAKFLTYSQERGVPARTWRQEGNIQYCGVSSVRHSSVVFFDSQALRPIFKWSGRLRLHIFIFLITEIVFAK